MIEEYEIKKQTALQAVDMFENNYNKSLDDKDRKLLIDFIMFIQFNILTEQEIAAKHTDRGVKNV